MKPYEFLPHTADAKFRAYGSTLEDAFTNAGLACFSILIDPKKVKSVNNYTITLRAKNYETLLFDFLDELLFHLDTDGFIVSEIKNLTIKKEEGAYKLTCRVFGDSHKNYEFSGNIKAVTYHEMFVKHEEKGWCVQVVVDL